MSVIVTKKRCAVYTRVSTDERLDQSFNSLDAQREAGQAYIAAQRHEGWLPVDDDYDDGGYSGGNMERPALKRLLALIATDQIDVVVVYKIDRLTRSLVDFARLIEAFERHKVSFVSVTQQFNTTTSMGRLMLNILLSFAQFEREVTGERIRDKIAASKRKGMWMGGYPPLGYDLKDRKLFVNEREAPTVQRIFERFAALGSVTELCRELAQDGVKTKAWQTRDGRMRNGTVMDKQYLSKALRNPVYVGEIRHKNVVHAGQHTPIISRQLWDRVQAILAADADQRAGMTRTRGKCDALLRGLLFGPNGEKYYPTFTKKASGKRYRYYYPQSDKKYGFGSSALGMLPADQIEEVVVNLVIQALQSPESMQAVWDHVRQNHPEIDEPTTVLAMRQLGEVWKQLFPEEQVRLINLLIERIDVLPDGIDIAWREIGWKELAGELAPDTIGSEMLEVERSQ
ncbi:resolvase domain-containing protein [Burkholderia pseudomallei]|uniref:recombinase family protein n=1 Tax=Burkholderia pseudomallei TaxID=28450 RepID=UPI000977A17C|nr:recombinase family protein [Burkholderia pseudomallei]OMS46618.1 recombinase [Burkholderia pseudomallei]CAJ3061813.1 resolvase domain-containing protein [Burkholderia pseudomallei]CAJ3069370.1 resolvase domain-containing protein [Burkholderia pseudomallei]CAJ3709117.1 resolvase domain-containing protein [Burkholderia pseudomallei]CAJ3724276.1 resolvase domain-containing protein [Burkholderia pseudomallei]